MTDQDRPSSPRRRAFLHDATSAGVASMLAPHTVLAQAQVSATPAASTAPDSAITVRTTEHLVGSAVNHAYAVKAGPFVFLNGHEGFDFVAGVVPAVAGAPGFPDYGKPGLRREADYVLEPHGAHSQFLRDRFRPHRAPQPVFHRGERGACLSPRAVCRVRQIHPAEHVDDH